ncbi:MAG: phage protease [Ornithinimicrobium sp.]
MEADANGNLPDRIHLLSIGHWHTPWHGAFEHTAEDLADMIVNFEEGTGLVAESERKAPVNYGHDRGGKAAGWIKSLSLENNGTELWGDVAWTDEGTRSVKSGEYQYISPEWNPRDFPWEDPEEEGVFVDNVFTGAGLTNIPLFKKLRPIMASTDVGNSDKPKQGGSMELKTVRAKKPEELSEDEKNFLVEHKADLTEDERTTFDIDQGGGADSNPNPDEGKPKDEPPTPDADPKQASTKTGLTDEQVKQLQADAKAGREAQQELLKTRLTASVKTHVDRGAITSDQLDSTVELLMASSEDTRTKLEAFMEALPENRIITAGEQGHGGRVAASAQAELMDRSKKLVADSQGKTKLDAAMKQVLAADSGLNERVNAERSSKQ